MLWAGWRRITGDCKKRRFYKKILLESRKFMTSRGISFSRITDCMKHSLCDKVICRNHEVVDCLYSDNGYSK
jgi:hypothetical protein